MAKILGIVTGIILLCVSVSAQNLVSRNGNLDNNTQAVLAIDYEHHEVHAGSHFTFSAIDADLDIIDTMAFIITTPNTTKWAHMIFLVNGQLATKVELLETTTRGLGVTQLDYNNDRNSADTSGIAICIMGDGGSDGTVIFTDRFGIDTGVGIGKVAGGGASRGTHEWILKQNTKYLFRVTSATDDNVASVGLSWYEHTNK